MALRGVGGLVVGVKVGVAFGIMGAPYDSVMQTFLIESLLFG